MKSKRYGRAMYHDTEHKGTTIRSVHLKLVLRRAWDIPLRVNVRRIALFKDE